MIRAVQKASKGLMQFGSVFFRIALFMIAVVIAISPIKEVCVAQIGRLSNRRIEQVIANDGFYNQSFSKPKYNVEARFAPDFITVKCVLDFEVQKEFKGFLPLMLYEGFQFDSVKYNEEDLPVKCWFKHGQVKCWRVYLPRLKAGDDVQLFLIYSGRPLLLKIIYYILRPKNGITTVGADRGHYLRCIIDQEWEPYFSGFSTLL